MAKKTSPKNRAEVKAKKTAPKKKNVPQRKQSHVEGVQANVEASAKDAARAKRLARKAAIDEEQSQVIEDNMTGEDIGRSDDGEELGQNGHEEVRELRLMVEGLTTRLVETQSILSSFTMKVEMLLLRGRESGSDVDCLIVENEDPTGIAESELMKHDCIFMRNMNSTGSNLLVRTQILLQFTIIDSARWERL